MNSVKKGYLAEGKQNKHDPWKPRVDRNPRRWASFALFVTVCDGYENVGSAAAAGSVSVWAAQMECPLQTHRRPSGRTYRIVEIQQISGQLGQFSCWSTLFLVFWNLWRSASHGAIQFHIASHTLSFTSTYRNQRPVWKGENRTYFCLWVS